MVSAAAAWPAGDAVRAGAPRLPFGSAGLSILLHGAAAAALAAVSLGEGGVAALPAAPGITVGLIVAEPAAGSPELAPGASREAEGDVESETAPPPTSPQAPLADDAAPVVDMEPPRPPAAEAAPMEPAPVMPLEPAPEPPPSVQVAAAPRVAARPAPPVRRAVAPGRAVTQIAAPGAGEGGGSASQQTASLPAGSDAGVIPLLSDPNFRARTPPAYPRRAVELGQQGEVIVEALLDGAGVPQSVRVHRSSGFPLLDAAALDAVRAWRFVPAQQAGRPVAARVRLPVRFRLNG